MSIKEKLENDLKNKEISDLSIVEKYICFGVPIIFKNNEERYYEFLQDLRNHFTLNSMRNIIIVGSSKLGFSIAPGKRFKDISDDSDIDVAIIDEELFDTYWEKLFEFNIKLKSRSNQEELNYRRFLEYFFKGWLRPDLFPFNYKGKNEWFDYFSNISYKKYDKRKVTAAIFKN